MVMAVLLGAGAGKRFGSEIPKQFLEIDGKSILYHACERLQSSGFIDGLIITSRAGEEEKIKRALGDLSIPCTVVRGGAERAHSVLAGLRSCPSSTQIVLIHDGARPNPSVSLIESLVKIVQSEGCGAVPGIPVNDTLKKVEEMVVKHTVDRCSLVRVQTPQVFPYGKILESYEVGLARGILGSDDSTYAEHFGLEVRLIEGESENLKITIPSDLNLFEYYLRQSHHETH
jgi:2-C-methyl-D-erythritol 4-phosphate cytidylyltransferase